MDVRLIWLEKLTILLLNHTEQSKEAFGRFDPYLTLKFASFLLDLLAEKLYDPDENVRYSAIKIIEEIVISKDQNVLSVLSLDVLKKIGSRTRDKKVLPC